MLLTATCVPSERSRASCTKPYEPLRPRRQATPQALLPVPGGTQCPLHFGVAPINTYAVSCFVCAHLQHNTLHPLPCVPCTRFTTALRSSVHNPQGVLGVDVTTSQCTQDKARWGSPSEHTG